MDSVPPVEYSNRHHPAIQPSRAPASELAVSIVSPPKIRRAVGRPHCCHMGWTAGSFPCTDVVSSTRRSARGWKHGATDGMQYAICNGTKGMKTEAARSHDGQGPCLRKLRGRGEAGGTVGGGITATFGPQHSIHTVRSTKVLYGTVLYSSTARRAISNRIGNIPPFRLGISEELLTAWEITPCS
jgi:hypothetical protein